MHDLPFVVELKVRTMAILTAENILQLPSLLKTFSILLQDGLYMGITECVWRVEVNGCHESGSDITPCCGLICTLTLRSGILWQWPLTFLFLLVCKQRGCITLRCTLRSHKDNWFVCQLLCRQLHIIHRLWPVQFMATMKKHSRAQQELFACYGLIDDNKW